MSRTAHHSRGRVLPILQGRVTPRSSHGRRTPWWGRAVRMHGMGASARGWQRNALFAAHVLEGFLQLENNHSCTDRVAASPHAVRTSIHFLPPQKKARGMSREKEGMNHTLDSTSRGIVSEGDFVSRHIFSFDDASVMNALWGSARARKQQRQRGREGESSEREKEKKR